MTKKEVHIMFINWIEGHPSDKWVITGGDTGKSFFALATNIKMGMHKQFDVSYEEEV